MSTRWNLYADRGSQLHNDDLLQYMSHVGTGHYNNCPTGGTYRNAFSEMRLGNNDVQLMSFDVIDRLLFELEYNKSCPSPAALLACEIDECSDTSDCDCTVTDSANSTTDAADVDSEDTETSANSDTEDTVSAAAELLASLGVEVPNESLDSSESTRMTRTVFVPNKGNNYGDSLNNSNCTPIGQCCSNAQIHTNSKQSNSDCGCS